MRALVTGGAGFIGRWVVRVLLQAGHQVSVLDDLSRGSEANLAESASHPHFEALHIRDVCSPAASDLVSRGFDVCYHLAASPVVQASLDHPRPAFETNVLGTFNVLEGARQSGTRVVFASTCLVYERADGEAPIDERHATRPSSPYSGAKLAAEQLCLSYWHSYGLPVTVLRPFNTYGPFQKSNGEGGVVGIFASRALRGLDLEVYGDGTQTRDLLYVEDCADFIIRAGLSSHSAGHILNAGTGRDISINDLALQIAGDPSRVRHVPHIHPQSEILRLRCDCGKASRLLGWQPTVPLEEGIERTRRWLQETQA